MPLNLFIIMKALARDLQAQKGLFEVNINAL